MVVAIGLTINMARMTFELMRASSRRECRHGRGLGSLRDPDGNFGTDRPI
jgi:hypothetical protein